MRVLSGSIPEVVVEERQRAAARADRTANHELVEHFVETQAAARCIDDRKHHLAVHVCAPDLLAGIRARHPERDCGVACVRIRDTRYVPIYELRAAFIAVFGGSAAALACRG